MKSPMIFVPGMFIGGRPFKMLGLEELHNTWGTTENLFGKNAAIWFEQVEFRFDKSLRE